MDEALSSNEVMSSISDVYSEGDAACPGIAEQEEYGMVAFQNDYIAGAHPEILKKLTETNFESLPGYGSDHYCESAK